MSTGDADHSTPAGHGGSALRGVAKIIAIIGVLGLVFVVSIKYAFSRLAIKVSNAPSLVINSEQIQGTFRLERYEVNGILSKGVGGACLIGDFAGQLTLAVVKEKGVVITTACTTREDCNPNFTKADDKAGPTHPQKWEGYCVPTDSLRFDKRGQRSCWYKPWDSDEANVKTDEQKERQLCNKSPYHAGAPWQLDQDHPMPLDNGFKVSDFYKTYTEGQPVRWLVSGRLFRTNSSTIHIDVFSPSACLAPPGGKPCLPN